MRVFIAFKFNSQNKLFIDLGVILLSTNYINTHYKVLTERRQQFIVKVVY